jgi:hypothetical protein
MGMLLSRRPWQGQTSEERFIPKERAAEAEAVEAGAEAGATVPPPSHSLRV